MSFELRAAAIVRLILDASLLHCTREGPTLLNLLCDTYRLLNEVSSLLVAVHGLSAECGSVFVDLAVYLAVGGRCLGLVELSCSRSLSLSLSSSSVVGLRSATSHLATALLLCIIASGD